MDNRSPDECFPNTHWTLIARASLSTEDGRRALANIVQRYVPALRAHLKYRHHLSAHDADDTLQSFIAERFLEKELASQADRVRGRFRSFLLASLDHFVVSRFRYGHAQRRDADRTVPLKETMQLICHEPAPETAVEISWARSVVVQALKLMENECNARGRQDVLAVFEARLVSVSLGAKPVSYLDLAQRYKLSSPTQAANLLITGKRMFARALRTVIADYEPNEEQIDQEITDLRSILSRA